MSEQVVELDDSDIIESIPAQEIPISGDWEDSLTVLFNESGEACVFEPTTVGDLAVGQQFVYQGEVCVKRNNYGCDLFNVESSSGIMFLHPTTKVKTIS